MFKKSLAYGLKLSRRKQDIKHIHKLNLWCESNDTRREIDEKAEQLKAIGEASTILGGFTIANLVEINIPKNVDSTLLSVYGACCALTISILIIAAIMSTYLLIAVYKFDCKPAKERDNLYDSSEFYAFDSHTNCKKLRFFQFWRMECEADWNRCFRFLIFGTFSFVLVFIELNWIKCSEHPKGNAASILVTLFLLLIILFWYIRIYTKWKSFLEKGYIKFKLLTPHSEI